MPIKANRNIQYWKKLGSDITFVCLIFSISYAICSYFNLSDHFFTWARAYEQSLDIDELPIALLPSLAALLWLSERRIYESNTLIRKNHALLQRVLEVQETERKRIASDLHDDLGQYLNAIKVQAANLLLENTKVDTHKTAQLISQAAGYSYQAARRMMQSLRPVALDELGLAAALEHLVETWASMQASVQNQTDYYITIRDNIDQFDEHINIGIFRIVQESLTNIAKHAKANVAKIDISYDQDSLTLYIKDDGIGFNTSKPNGGYGLIGIKERTEALGGLLTINSSKEGTELIIKLNIEHRATDSDHTHSGDVYV